MTNKKFWEGKKLSELSREQWEALCDGCGRCCLHKVEDETTGRIYQTNLACRLLDLQTAQCSNYRHRRSHVPDCLQLRPDLVSKLYWLPKTCAYRLVDEGKPLPDWHYLVSGSRETVHEAGISIRGWAVNELDAGDIENHILEDDPDGDD